mmetsp:Transcript_31964/g.83227  ORF Transcript_31964/g.83227 Transcript_31964/m.83227 type:complete len:87 (+) Transcript_31964:381-641(+)
MVPKLSINISLSPIIHPVPDQVRQEHLWFAKDTLTPAAQARTNPCMRMNLLLQLNAQMHTSICVPVSSGSTPEQHVATFPLNLATR